MFINVYTKAKKNPVKTVKDYCRINQKNIIYHSCLFVTLMWIAHSTFHSKMNQSQI